MVVARFIMRQDEIQMFHYRNEVHEEDKPNRVVIDEGCIRPLYL